MTREEAIFRLIDIRKEHKVGVCEIEALEMAISVLEQQPCDDAISREAVLDLLANRVPNPYYENVFRVVDELPSVTHSRHKGHWMLNKEKSHLNHHVESRIATKVKVIGKPAHTIELLNGLKQ